GVTSPAAARVFLGESVSVVRITGREGRGAPSRTTLSGRRSASSRWGQETVAFENLRSRYGVPGGRSPPLPPSAWPAWSSILRAFPFGAYNLGMAFLGSFLTSVVVVVAVLLGVVGPA